MTQVDENQSARAASPDPSDESSSRESPNAFRVIVVGDQGLASTVQQAAEARNTADGRGAKVVVVDDFFAAIGELGQQTADAVVGPARGLNGIEQATANAIRQLAPDARLITFTAPQTNGRATTLLDAGFDACLSTPLTSDDLSAALRGKMTGLNDQPDKTDLKKTSRDEGGSGFSKEDSPNTDTVNEAVSPEPHGNDQPDAAAQGPPTEQSRPAGSGRQATDPETPEPAGGDASPDEPVANAGAGEETALGDVDLIEAVLDEAGTLRPLAMQVIAQQSPLHEPGLAERAEEAPRHHNTCAVTYRGEPFGVLHAQSPASELAAWAGWLGRWLAMEQRIRRLHEQAMRDELTGVWNRRYFHQFLDRVLPWAQRDRSQVTVLVFDIDDFKYYNDAFGHPAGDDILVNVGQLMQSLVRDHDVVARIGGDEFAVIFWEAEGPRKANSRHPQDVLDVAHRFQDAICQHRFPKLLDEAASTLTISGGLASYPWDGRTTEELIANADANALTSKRQGKNVITFGPGACQHEPTRQPPADQPDNE